MASTTSPIPKQQLEHKRIAPVQRVLLRFMVKALTNLLGKRIALALETHLFPFKLAKYANSPKFTRLPELIEPRRPRPKAQDFGSEESRKVNWVRKPPPDEVDPQEVGIYRSSSCVALSHPLQIKWKQDLDPTGRVIKVLDQNRTVLPITSSFGTKNILKRYSDMSLRECRLPGTTLLAGSYFHDSRNYFHTWWDVIGDLWLAKYAGINFDHVNWFFVPWAGTQWQDQIAELCNIDRSKIIPTAAASIFAFEDLVVPIRPKGGREYFGKTYHGIHEMAGWDRSFESKPNRRIYVKRGETALRPMINEEDIQDLVEGYGFETIDCSKLSVPEQQSIFSQAEAIIAPHGAALTNLLWAQPGARVLDIIPATAANPCFYYLSSSAHLAYHPVPADIIVDQKDAGKFKTKARSAVLYAEISRLFD